MKKTTPQAVVTSEIQPEFRIIKTATCKSLSGKSDLTYHLGVDEESNLHLRMFASSSSGYFSQEWVPYSAIQSILTRAPFITSFTLRSLYVGKSTNSPGFLLSALKAEGLVKLKGEKERVYVALLPVFPTASGYDASHQQRIGGRPMIPGLQFDTAPWRRAL